MSVTKCINNFCQGQRTWNISTKQFSPCNVCGEPKTAKKEEDTIEKNMERKEQFINKSLDKKNTAIEIAGAKRDAVLIVTAMMNQLKEPIHEDTIKEELESWARYWLNFDPSQEPKKEETALKIPDVNNLF